MLLSFRIILSEWAALRSNGGRARSGPNETRHYVAWVFFRRFAWAQHGLAGPSLAQLVWVRPAVKRILSFVCLYRRVLFLQALARCFVVVASLWLLLACFLACLLLARQRFL